MPRRGTCSSRRSRGRAAPGSATATVLDPPRETAYVTIHDDAQTLLADLRAECAKPQSERGTGASDEDLRRAASYVEASLDDRVAASELARLVTDQWSLTDSLSEQVVAFAHRAADR